MNKDKGWSAPFSALGVVMVCAVMSVSLFVWQLVGLVLFIPWANQGEMSVFEASQNGIVVASSVIFTAFMMSITALAWVKLKRLSVRQYFAMTAFVPKAFWVGLGLLLAFMMGSELISVWLSRDPMLFMEVLVESAPWWLIVAAVVVVAPIYEEVVFRGLIWRSIADRFGNGWAMWISSALFALIHLQYDMFEMGLIFVLALIFAYIRQTSGSLILPIILHMINNGLAMAQFLWVSGNGY